MHASEFLEQQATTSLPWYVTAPLFVWVIGILGLRSIVLVDKRSVDRAIAWFAFWLIVVALLREPWVHSPLFKLGFELSDIRVMTHTAAIAAAAAIFMLGLYWREVRRPPKRLLPALVAFTIGCGLALFLVSLPARDHGVAVEELENWRTGLYMTIYSLPTPVAEVLILAISAGLIRERSTSARVFLGTVVFVAAATSTFDHLSRLAVGWFLSFGVHNGLTDARAESNDLFFLPVMAGLAVLAIPSIVTSIRIHRGRDSAAVAVKVLGPMWSTLTNTLPQYRLPQTHGLGAASGLEHRMRVEIEDCIGVLNYHLPPGTEWPGDPQGRAQMLMRALAEYEKGTPPTSIRPPSWLSSSDQVLALAAAWSDINTATTT